MNSFSALRLASTSGRPCVGVLCSAEVSVAAKIFTPGIFCADVRDALLVAGDHRLGRRSAAPKSLMPSSQITAATPGRLMMSRSRRVSARRPAGDRLGGVVVGPDHLVAADARFTTAKRVAVGGMQAARQHVGPAVVAVERGAGAVGDRIAERDDRLRAGRRRMSTASRKYQDAVEKGNAASPSSRALRAAAGRAEVRGLQRLGVPGHRPALAGDVEAHRQLAAAQHRVGWRLARRRAPPDRSTDALAGRRRSRSSCRRTSPAGSCRAPARRRSPAGRRTRRRK